MLWQLEADVNKSQQSIVDEFVQVFASGSETGQFDASASQALYLRNGPRLTEWLQPKPGRLVARLQELRESGDAKAVVEHACLSIYGRLPNDDELPRLTAFLDAFGDDSLSGIQALTRSMLCSAEFRLNH